MCMREWSNQVRDTIQKTKLDSKERQIICGYWCWYFHIHGVNPRFLTLLLSIFSFAIAPKFFILKTLAGRVASAVEMKIKSNQSICKFELEPITLPGQKKLQWNSCCLSFWLVSYKAIFPRYIYCITNKSSPQNCQLLLVFTSNHSCLACPDMVKSNLFSTIRFFYAVLFLKVLTLCLVLL